MLDYQIQGDREDGQGWLMLASDFRNVKDSPASCHRFVSHETPKQVSARCRSWTKMQEPNDVANRDYDPYAVPHR